MRGANLGQSEMWRRRSSEAKATAGEVVKTNEKLVANSSDQSTCECIVLGREMITTRRF